MTSSITQMTRPWVRQRGSNIRPRVGLSEYIRYIKNFRGKYSDTLACQDLRPSDPNTSHMDTCTQINKTHTYHTRTHDVCTMAASTKYTYRLLSPAKVTADYNCLLLPPPLPHGQATPTPTRKSLRRLLVGAGHKFRNIHIHEQVRPRQP